MSDSTEDFQLGIDILYNHCTRWKLNINIEKSAVVIFRKGGLLSINDHFFFSDALLTITTNTYAYLGMLLSDSGKFDVLQKNIANCSTTALFKLYKELHHLHNPKIQFLFEIFDKIIIPICDYGYEVGIFLKAPAIEGVHLQFLKCILHVKKYTAIFFSLLWIRKTRKNENT